MRRVCLLLLCCSACAQLSSIQPVGPDAYSVMATAQAADLTKAHDAALASAKTHCDKQGRELLVIKTRVEGDSYEVVFRCLPQGDPALSTPQ